MPAIGSAVSDLEPITLDEVLALADLQVRLDRKYLVPVDLVAKLIDDLGGSLRALEIGGRRGFKYESTYFDTRDMLAYRLHAGERRRRFKVRTRTYLDTQQCMLEVKTEGTRGRTLKERTEHPLSERDHLTPTALTFVHAQLRREFHDPGLVLASLTPRLVTAYSRRTLVDPRGGHRVTIDSNLEFRSLVRSVTGPADFVLLETKSPNRPTSIDRWLWWHRVRPVSLSKYCLGAAALDWSLPASRWSRVLRRHFTWESHRDQPARPQGRLFDEETSTAPRGGTA